MVGQLIAALLGDPETAAALAVAAACLVALLRPRLGAAPRFAVAAAWTAAGLIALLALGAGPAADDFTYAVGGRDGWPAFQAQHWSTWSGRFLATAVLSGWPRILPLDAAYPLIVLAVWGLLLSGLWALGRPLLPPAWTPEQGRTVRAWGLLALLAGWPSLAEGVTWLAGAVTYVLPLGLAAWCLAWLLLPEDQPATARRSAAVALALLATGGSELATLLLLAGLGAGGWWMWRRRDPRLGWLLAALAAASAGAASALGAPGNRVRAQALAEASAGDIRAPVPIQALASGWAVVSRAFSGLGTWAALIAAALATARSGGFAAPRWALPLALAAVPGIAVTLAVLPALAGSGIPPRVGVVLWFAAWLAAITAAVLAGSQLRRWRPAWALRLLAASTRPGRSTAIAGLAGAAIATAATLAVGLVGIATGLVVIAAAATALLAMPRLRRHRSRERRRRLGAGLAGWIAILAITGSAGWGAVQLAAGDALLLPQRWQARSDRLGRIRAAAPGSAVQVPPWPDRATPRGCVALDATSDPKDWSNQAMADWYRLGSLRIAP